MLIFSGQVRDVAERMEKDTQHLEFLISQHVDGSLDAMGKKTLEQELLQDPDARKLYQSHRDVQDVLDDWGSRIPLINWDEFDQKLTVRLEKETVGSEQKKTRWGWVKPTAAAAALLLAASLGYGWHAYSATPAAPVTIANGNSAPVTPLQTVRLEDMQAAGRGSSAQFRVEDGPAGTIGETGLASNVSVGAPGDIAADQSLEDAVSRGLSNLSTAMDPNRRPGAVSAVVGFENPKSEDHFEGEAPPPLP